MLDIDTVKRIVQAFAEKYALLQQSDIDKYDEIENFHVYMQACNKIHGKKAVCIEEYQAKTDIMFGKIYISVDKDDEGDEEFYGIAVDSVFRIHVADAEDEESLVEAMVQGCTSHKIIKLQEL